MVKLSLTLLKEKQYPLELTNLRHTLNILDQAKMAEALIEDLEQNSFNLRKKIGGFKKVFGQKIQEAKAKADQKPTFPCWIPFCGP
jgi:DNA mismatch repair ATPase MutS